MAGTQRAKITEKVHKPPRNHYIEWPVFSDIGLNCESQGEKGRTCKKYKILIGSRVFFFHFIHDFPFSPGHLLESEERFVNLFCNFSPLCAAALRCCFSDAFSSSMQTLHNSAFLGKICLLNHIP